jgi:hypothetical protein
LAKGIRLRYSGLIVFASQVLSVFTGLAFLIFLTRNVAKLEYFGVWGYIMLIVSYITFPNCLVTYWATRYTARGLKVAKTSLVMILTFSIVSFAVFILISPYLAKTVGIAPLYFMVGSFLVPIMYVLYTLGSIAQGCVPHILGYGVAIFEISKVILAFIAIVYLKTGLYGALISVTIAQLAQVIFLLVRLWNRLTEGNIDLNTTKKWLRMGWVPLYSSLPSILLGAGPLIITLLTFSAEPIAFWNAATAITAIVGYSTQLAFALYPKLLSGGNERDVETSFELVLMFAVPLAIGAELLAGPLLQILRAQFIEAAIILRVDTLNVFLSCIMGMLGSVIIGTEKVDTENATFKKLLKSRLFLLPTLSYIQAFVYLPAICIASAIIVSLSLGPFYLNLPLACELIELSCMVPIFTYEYKLAKKILPFKFPVKSLAKYSLASIALAAVIIFFYPKRADQTIVSVFLGAFAYFCVLFVIDKNARRLMNSIVSTFKSKV